MTIRGWRRAAVVMSVLIGSIVQPLSQANAEDNTGDWTVVAISEDPCGKMTPLRAGYYNLGTGGGWGHWKIIYKHGIDRIRVWRGTMTAIRS